jgi:hypothetical protein
MSKPKTIEQRRRDLMAADRALYDYICHREAAKVLDQAGDSVSGVHHGAANRIWAMKAEHTTAVRMAQRE